MTATSISHLPPFPELVRLVRTEGPEVLDQYAPAIGTLVDAASAAELVGWKVTTLYRNQRRLRADGRPDFPPPDKRYGRSGVWSIKTIVLHRADTPGQGAAGRAKPRRAQHAPVRQRPARQKHPTGAAA